LPDFLPLSLQDTKEHQVMYIIDYFLCAFAPSRGERSRTIREINFDTKALSHKAHKEFCTFEKNISRKGAKKCVLVISNL